MANIQELSGTAVNEWLESTKENTVEPDLKICDAHHHFWDGRTEFGAYSRYILDEFNQDIYGGHNICSTVFVEASAMYRSEGPENMRSVGEVEFVQGIAAASASGLYGDCKAAAAIVGRADLTLGESVKPVLEALNAASINRFRGIRHAVNWDPDDEISNATPATVQGQLLDPKFRAGAAVLSEMGMSFDVWLYFTQLLELADFARSLPDLTIVLNHIGGPVTIGRYLNKQDEVMSTWKNGITALAECNNVVVKLGGMARLFKWESRQEPISSAEFARESSPFVNFCIEQFKPDRCMFESNFPVDKQSVSYNVLWNGFKKLCKGYSSDERSDMLHDTASRVYRID